MPFTPTHIIAIAPLVILAPRLPLSALAIGAMIPDLPLFAPWGPSYGLTHSLSGIFLACLPLGIGVFALFQYLLKRPLLALLPPGLQGRLMPWSAPLRGLSPSLAIRVAIAITLGAGSHILWDSFTHAGRLGVQLFPVLSDGIGVFEVDWPLYKIFQIGSTLFLLPAFVLFLALWLRAQTPHPALGIPKLSPPRRWLILLALLVLPVLIGSLMALGQGGTGYEILGGGIRKSGGLMALGSVIYGGMMALGGALRRGG